MILNISFLRASLNKPPILRYEQLMPHIALVGCSPKTPAANTSSPASPCTAPEAASAVTPAMVSSTHYMRQLPPPVPEHLHILPSLISPQM